MKVLLQIVLLGFASVFGLLSVPVLSLGAASPEGEGLVLVVAGPGADLHDIISRSGGNVSNPLEAPFGLLSYSPEPAYSERLIENGAWLVLDGATLATICGNTSDV